MVSASINRVFGFTLLITLTLFHGHLCLAWKPIASSGASYTLKQSHPGEASSSHELATSYAQFNGDNNKDEEDLVLAHAALVDGVKTGSGLRLNADQENHYESYSLGDEAIKDPSLSFARSPLYVSDSCSVKKFAFNQDGIVIYDNELPELDQFTICFWMRFTNHSGDHVMFTYEGISARFVLFHA